MPSLGYSKQSQEDCMSNIVPYAQKSVGFLTAGKTVRLPALRTFEGLTEFPSWIHYWRETRNAFQFLGEKDLGNFSVTSYACDWWDMHPKDILAFIGENRTPWDSWLYLGEVLLILCCDQEGLIQPLKSPFYFIVPGWGDEFHLLEVRRKGQYAYCIDTSRELSIHSRIPRRKPLFVPKWPR